MLWLHKYDRYIVLVCVRPKIVKSLRPPICMRRSFMLWVTVVSKFPYCIYSYSELVKYAIELM